MKIDAVTIDDTIPGTGMRLQAQVTLECIQVSHSESEIHLQVHCSAGEPRTLDPSLPWVSLHCSMRQKKKCTKHVYTGNMENMLHPFL